MAGLQVLEDKFGSRGFHVLGFLSNDFGSQGGTSGEIDACNAQYGITFKSFAIDHVVPSGTDMPEPVFAWLESQPTVGPDANPMPTWNFSKYLISRKGVLVNHWDSPVYPGDDPNDPNDSFDTNAIVVAIEAELGAPQ